MVLRTAQGVTTGEDVEDLRAFLSRLPEAPPVHETVVLACANHEDDRPTWTYVEADPAAGVARRRCLQCAQTVFLLDSEQRWTHPPMWSCGSCHQSIAEVAVGLSAEDGEHVTWAVVGARCVECGRVGGLTDFVLPGTPLAEVLDRL
jgi:ribosomal protein S27AE